MFSFEDSSGYHFSKVQSVLSQFCTNLSRLRRLANLSLSTPFAFLNKEHSQHNSKEEWTTLYITI